MDQEGIGVVSCVAREILPVFDLSPPAVILQVHPKLFSVCSRSLENTRGIKRIDLVLPADHEM
jgi:hypothetical protein